MSLQTVQLTVFNFVVLVLISIRLILGYLKYITRDTFLECLIPLLKNFNDFVGTRSVVESWILLIDKFFIADIAILILVAKNILRYRSEQVRLRLVQYGIDAN